MADKCWYCKRPLDPGGFIFRHGERLYCSFQCDASHEARMRITEVRLEMQPVAEAGDLDAELRALLGE